MKKKFKAEKHLLIPKHSKLTDKQKEKLLDDYKVTLKELPRVVKSDPAVQSLEAKPGDVIKITRNSTTAGEISFYRVVIDV